MVERTKFIEKCYIFLLFTLIIALVSTINFYTSNINVHVFNYSEVKEAIAVRQTNLSSYSLISKTWGMFDQCERLSSDENLCNISITVKTTKSNHQKKLKPIIQTWFNQLPSKVSYNRFLLFKYFEN